jgi:CheY-like chemotaxis protein
MIKEKYKILFIDDSHTEINYLKLLFQIIDFPAEAVFINSALEALEQLNTLGDEDFPDCIIVDINMPFISGFEFAEKYLKSIHLKHPKTKLFIYSTSLHSKDISQAKSIDGVSGFIPKPFDQNSFDEFILPLIDVESNHQRRRETG